MAHKTGILLAAGLLVGLAACGGGADSGSGGGSAGGGGGATITPEQVAPSDKEQVVSALDDRFDPRLPEPLIEPAQVRSGGPPPDGIPPIDEPKFQKASGVDWLGDREPVLSLTVNDETRAYPLRVMTWHEIVNDTVGGVPVAVTYCPLCNSGVAFERELGDRVLSFGTSGMLYADNLVMYDRQTETLWPQLTGTGSIGELTGERLTAIPMGIVGWSDWRADNPDSLVLTEDTGHDRPYGRNPYVGYDNPDTGLLFGVPGDADERLRVKDRVIGIERDGDAVAILRDALNGSGPVELSVGGDDVVVWHRAGQASALGSSEISEGDDIGTVAVYEPVAGDQRLTFEDDGELFRDNETGSTWNVLGRAVKGPLEGEQLQAVTHLDTFWFSWVTFHPETELKRSV